MSIHQRLAILIVIIILLITGCGEDATISKLESPTNTPAPSEEITTPGPAKTGTPLSMMSETPTLTKTIAPSPTKTLTQSPTMTPTIGPQLSGPYIGQEPPGMEPRIFAPGFISSPEFSEYSGAFSPDGEEYYFFRYTPTTDAVLLVSKVLGGLWSVPEQVEVTAGYAAFEPYVTVDNQRLYFNWGYPVSPGEPQFPYYFVERTQDGWSEPIFAGQGMFMSSSQDGQLYTTDMSSRDVNGKTYIAKITTTDGVFTDYERLDIKTHGNNPAHPCIAPDGSYILFDVGGGYHLFVSFKEPDGTWGEPIDLTEHGFDQMVGGAYISPDGKYMFFALDKDIWWVDIKVIENLR